MKLSIFSSLLLFISLFSLFQTPIFAKTESYIVLLRKNALHSNASFDDYDRAVKYHQELLTSCLGSARKAKRAIFYSYYRYINGFAAVLDDEDVPKVKNHPDVISVFQNMGRLMHTTNSWEFLGLERDFGNNVPLDSAWRKARFGEDVIIGNFDSGIWPESESFNDEGMGPVPTRWRGICQTNNRDGIKCNRKLIGVRFFNKGYLRYCRREARRHNKTYVPGFNVTTARDYIGHGTNTLAAAAGNFVANANFFGQANGTAKGGSPKARVAVYKVCWHPTPEGSTHMCHDADIMAGFEAAISDGVDVISASFGVGQIEYYDDATAVGSFHATKNGILVVTAAGNDGPSPGSVSNVIPWVFTVGASTINRQFVNYVTLGNKQVLKGASLSTPKSSASFYPLITGLDAKANNASIEDAVSCNSGAIDPKKINGKILVCENSAKQTILLGLDAAKAGAVGTIFVNVREENNHLLAEPHLTPASQLNFKDGQTLLAYINSTKSPIAQLSDVHTEFNTTSAPVMARFSSRGPNDIDSAILKPDVTAPGSNILSAYSPIPTASAFPSDIDNRHVPYVIAYGTSIACPHVSGIAGLVKTVHPDWSASAIKSAIMTTASPSDVNSRPLRDYNDAEATPFAYGAGHVNPNAALDPGLVYDLTSENYLDYLCAHGYNDTVIRAFTVSDKPYSCPKSFRIEDFNYPSIVVPKFQGSTRVTRYLKNVGSPGTYNISVEAPVGITIWAEPKSLKFEKYGDEKKFELNIGYKGNADSSKNNTFGKLVWSDGHHFVRSSIVIRL